MAGEAQAAEAAAHGAEYAGGGFPPFDSSLFSSQIFWFWIAFGALYIILATTVLPKIAATLATRRKTIDDDLSAAQRESEAAQAARAEADAAVAASRAQARATVDAVRKEADAAAAAASEKLAVETAQRLQAAEIRIGASKASALAEVEGVVGELAGAIVQQLTGKAPTAAALKAALKGGA
jgi:F-type H+-transporting ATPase subunit b